VPGWESHHAVVAPVLEQRALVIGRRGEPPFFASELARLAYLVGGPDSSEITDPALSKLSAAHRTPISVPLHTRENRELTNSTPGPQ
jgi:hypothetical protein